VRVLVAEDHAILARTVARGLRAQGMSVDVAADGQDALDKIDLVSYEVIVLDRDLPLVHGDEVCAHAIHRWAGAARILMLTAATEVTDRVEGLNIGADDYLGKPFVFDELVARVNALARRTGPARPPVLERAGIRLDPGTHAVTRDGRPLRLSRKEYEVLRVLLAADGTVVSAEQLLEQAWDEFADPFTTSMRVTLARIRAKLGDPPVIETLIGAGYRIP
jgi:DNA-binding response OmpR family regulator